MLFLGDNGPLPTLEQQRTAGLRGSKLSLYEGGIRVPGLAWGPGLVQPGLTNRETVFASVDLLPSLCKLAGDALPDGSDLDGEDLSEAAPWGTRHSEADEAALLGILAQQYLLRLSEGAGMIGAPNVAVRQGDWKLLVNADGTHPELYDLASDPRETVDLSAARPEIARQLTESALGWRRSLP